MILPDTCDLPQERDPDGLLWMLTGTEHVVLDRLVGGAEGARL